MSHQIYFVHTEPDVQGFLNIIYGKGGAYDPACLKRFQRIKTGMRKACHDFPDAGHSMSDRLLMGCLEGSWSAVCFHGAPIPIPDRKKSEAEESGDTR